MAAPTQNPKPGFSKGMILPLIFLAIVATIAVLYLAGIITLPGFGSNSSKESIYSGSFIGIGQFTMPVPEWGTTCVFEDDYSGTIDMDLTEAANGAVNGTARIIMGWTSMPLSGTTANFECLSGTPSMDKTGAVSGNKDSITFTISYTSTSGYEVTEKFTGSLSGNKITGTLVDTSTCCSGSGIIPVTLTAQ